MEGKGFLVHQGMNVAHALPGRLRVHVNREWARLVPELVSKLRSRSEMRAVRWSPAARSLTIEFDPSLRQHDVLHSLAVAPSAKEGGAPHARGTAWEAIAWRAYELYLGRGATHGHDLDDWLAAERELESRHTTPGSLAGIS